MSPHEADLWGAAFIIMVCALYDLLRWLAKRNAKQPSAATLAKTEQIAPFDECFEEDDW
jgi:hypothetical protein